MKLGARGFLLRAPPPRPARRLLRTARPSPALPHFKSSAESGRRQAARTARVQAAARAGERFHPAHALVQLKPTAGGRGGDRRQGRPCLRRRAPRDRYRAGRRRAGGGGRGPAGGAQTIRLLPRVILY